MRFNGLIVAVGTDTLSYIVPAVASYLHAALKDSSSSDKLYFDAPIIFISGMKPWRIIDSDSSQNFLDATSFLRECYNRGSTYKTVLVVSSGAFYWPYNLTKVSHEAIDPFRLDLVDHPKRRWKRLDGVIRDRYVKLSATPNLVADLVDNLKPFPWLPFPSARSVKAHDYIIKPIVAQVQVFPGLLADSVERFIGDQYRHVIFRCYSNGTAPVSDAGPEFNLARVVKNLHKRGVMSYSVSQQIGAIDPASYEVCKEMEQAGCLYVRKFNLETLHSLILILSALLRKPTDVYEYLSLIEQGTTSGGISSSLYDQINYDYDM